ncbi:PilZ domain-containing protein [Aquibacillus rhizosphaerae]|uniref:PilZ domain-containing protein n=1 Tax=Aquibacillus rhizosphaerae TaxID=3051431 RepID=A0ABT7L8H5_9BACI|nr:PilZ domain-containing protein [Aquibacillus sp. LR5S19]MDL4842168.1 PilZ domain-containing protein [Aquibacillus sp. LR5S19]
MYYKRNEAFRYVFNQPFPAKVKSLSNEPSHDVFIHDISLNGVKMESHTEFQKEKALYLEFTLLDQDIIKTGVIMWKKSFGKRFQYGLKLDVDQSYHEQIIHLLKQLVKNNS